MPEYRSRGYIGGFARMGYRCPAQHGHGQCGGKGVACPGRLDIAGNQGGTERLLSSASPQAAAL